MQEHPLSVHWDTIRSLEISQQDFQKHLDDMEVLDAQVEESMGQEGKNEIRVSSYAFAIKLLGHLGIDPVSFQKLLNQKNKINKAIKLRQVSEESVDCLVDNLGIVIAQRFIQTITDDIRIQLGQALYAKKEHEFPLQLRAKGVPIKNPTDEIEQGIRQIFLGYF